jgi:hypothetical protein
MGRHLRWGLPLLLIMIAGGAILYFATVRTPQFSDPLGLDAAKAACQEHGWQRDELQMVSSVGNGSGWSQSQKVVLMSKNKDKPKTIHVDLEWHLGTSDWTVTGYSEEAGPDEPRVDQDKQRARAVP